MRFGVFAAGLYRDAQLHRPPWISGMTIGQNSPLMPAIMLFPRRDFDYAMIVVPALSHGVHHIELRPETVLIGRSTPVSAQVQYNGRHLPQYIQRRVASGSITPPKSGHCVFTISKGAGFASAV